MADRPGDPDAAAIRHVFDRLLAQDSLEWPYVEEARAALDEIVRRLSVYEQALRELENDWMFVFNLADGVELTYDVRRALAEKNLRALRAALTTEPGHPAT